MKRVVQNFLYFLGIFCFAVAVIALVIHWGKVTIAAFNQQSLIDAEAKAQETAFDVEPVVEGPYRSPVENSGTEPLAEERPNISRDICCPQSCIAHFEEFRSWFCPVDNCK